MIPVVLETPYAGDVEGNISFARACLKDCLDRGESPLASHLLYTQVLDDQVPQEREKGIRAGLEWAQRADRAVFYVDRGWSPGMIAALNFYLEHHVPVTLRVLLGRN